MESKETMGKRISDLRKSKGMTQEQLAQRVGVTAQAVSKWENDLSCPDISILPQLAEALDVTTDELLGKVQLRSLAVEDGQRTACPVYLRNNHRKHKGSAIKEGGSTLL